MVACVLPAMRLVPPCLDAAMPQPIWLRISCSFRLIWRMLIPVVHCLPSWTLAYAVRHAAGTMMLSRARLTRSNNA